MFSFIFKPSMGKSGNPLIDFVNTYSHKTRSHDSGILLGNYDSDDDAEDNQDYDPDEDLHMMFDDEEYDELHESY